MRRTANVCMAYVGLVLLLGVPGCAKSRPSRFVAVPDAEYAPLDGLAQGSAEAQQRQRAAVESLTIPLETVNSAGMRFRLVPSGAFLMGSPADEPGGFPNEQPVHSVNITQAFYLGTHEVTQRQWTSVMGENPARFLAAGPDAPVESVSWDDIQEFLARLCEDEGAAPGTYRLPTESEWEYACRAGTTGALYTGDLSILGERNGPELDPVGWYAGNSGVSYDGYDSAAWTEKQFDHAQAGTHGVGLKLANAWGLYDMHGNVWEWCEDWIDAYPDGEVADPTGPPSGSHRRSRGGSWHSIARFCRSAMRGAALPDSRGYDMGFRVVRELPTPAEP